MYCIKDQVETALTQLCPRARRDKRGVEAACRETERGELTAMPMSMSMSMSMSMCPCHVCHDVERKKKKESLLKSSSRDA